MVSSFDLRPLLLREGLIDEDDGSELDVAAIVDKKILEEDQLADLLAREAGSVVIDLDQGTLEAEAVALVGETLARRSLAVPVALEPGDGAIQVAFANPLDTGNMAAIAASTGATVRALVATVTSIRRALDREYGTEPSTTQVLDMRAKSPPTQEMVRPPEPAEPPAETPAASREESNPEDSKEQPLPSESTRRLSEQGPVTLPLHRLESEATLEQRFEALVLALVDRGAIARTDYAEALRRLLRQAGDR